MALFARSDLMSVSIPRNAGGCGATHTRPVTHGSPVKTWKLVCPECESYLRGDQKPKVIKVIPGDKENQVPSRMEHVADCDPHWSNTPEGIPATPDEQHVNKIRTDQGERQLQMLSAFSAAKSSGIKIPDNVMWLLEQTFDPRVIKGTVICPNGHDNRAGAKHCDECGKKMDGEPSRALPAAKPRRQRKSEVPEDDNPLNKLSATTLRAMAKEKGLPANGSKAALVERLS